VTARYLMLLILVAAPVLAQDHAKPSSPPNTAVTVKGEDGKIESFDAAALSKLPQREMHAEAHGKAVSCSGPTLSDVLAKAGAPQGEALRGKGLALYAKVTGRDDYRVVYSLAELDTASHDNVPILTTRCDGKDLDNNEGPFRVIYPGEKRPMRWIRQVSSIELLRAP
jgi:hypothetical protein